MAEVRVKHEHQTPVGWKFTVEIDGADHTVEVDREYWNHITHGHEQPAHLVERSIKFLLARESPREILRHFDLRDIKNYFPDYEDEIDHRK